METAYDRWGLDLIYMICFSLGPALALTWNISLVSITQDKLRLCPPRARRRLVFNAPSWEFTECKKNHPSVDSNPSYYPSEQFRQGFLGSLLVVLRLRENAVLHGGPPCSSFVFINSFTHGRTKSSPLGKFRLRGYVRAANTSHGSINKKRFY